MGIPEGNPPVTSRGVCGNDVKMELPKCIQGSPKDRVEGSFLTFVTLFVEGKHLGFPTIPIFHFSYNSRNRTLAGWKPFESMYFLFKVRGFSSQLCLFTGG